MRLIDKFKNKENKKIVLQSFTVETIKELQSSRYVIDISGQAMVELNHKLLSGGVTRVKDIYNLFE